MQGPTQSSGGGTKNRKRATWLSTKRLSKGSCGAYDVVTRTFERVIEGFLEALEGRNAMALNGLVPEALRSLAQDLDAWSLLTANHGGAGPQSRPSVL